MTVLQIQVEMVLAEMSEIPFLIGINNLEEPVDLNFAEVARYKARLSLDTKPDYPPWEVTQE